MTSNATYHNAQKVLPPGLLGEVQRHFSGHLWVPAAEPQAVRVRQRVVQLSQAGIGTGEIAEMTQLRRMYGARTIQLAPTTYRMYADWMNCVLDDARQHLSLRALEYAIERWQGDPVVALLADGTIAGIQLPKAVKDTLQTMCQHGTPTTVADAQHQPAISERSASC